MAESCHAVREVKSSSVSRIPLTNLCTQCAPEQNFPDYVRSIEDKCRGVGLCKVIPPKEYVARAAGYHFDNVGFAGNTPRTKPAAVRKARRRPGADPVVIRNPIRQHVNGSRGVYEVISVLDTDVMTVGAFERQCADMIDSTSKRDREHFRKDKLNELERSYWRNLANCRAPLYGADSPGSLFDSDQNAWNMTRLDTLLDLVKGEVPGVTAPMLYFGMWKASFAWHVEDMNLFSINYLHFGKPKQWYAIPASHFEQTQRVLKGLYPMQARQCPEFLRHKKCIVSPGVLKKHNIPIYSCVQREGEFMITFPRSFHAGFNYGFNCAESVNFALKSWVAEAADARSCECTEDSVRIDIPAFVDRMVEHGVITASDPLIKVVQERSKCRKRGGRGGPQGPIRPWVCLLCTFLNKRARRKCSVCLRQHSKRELQMGYEIAESIAKEEEKDKASGEEDGAAETDGLVAATSDDGTEPVGESPARSGSLKVSTSSRRKRKSRDGKKVSSNRVSKSRPSNRTKRQRRGGQDLDVGALLKSIGIARKYAHELQKHCSSLSELQALKGTKLLKESLPLGPRMKLLNHLRTLRPARTRG